MPTVKQTELINELISKLNEDEKRLCEPVIDYLLELGYAPRRHKKSSFAVAFVKYKRVIAKLEHGKRYKTDKVPRLGFSLRFSASDQYTQVFQDAVDHRSDSWIRSGGRWQPKDFDCCGLCKGKPRFYHYTGEDGARFDLCGGYTKRVPGVTADDVPEILRMIREQDEHFTEMFAE